MIIKRKRVDLVKVIVPLSGGKDSQACLKLALEQYEPHEVRGLFCDTQFEHPWTYAHIEKLRTIYGSVRIDTVCGGSVIEQAIKEKRFPVGGARGCTKILKIRQSRLYYSALAEKQRQGFEVWYGMRNEESKAREKRYKNIACEEKYPPHEVLSQYPKYLAKMGVLFRLAILDWSSDEVFYFLGGEENPLYSAGFDRVGCFPCLASGDAWKEKAFAFDDFGLEQFAKVQAVENLIGKRVWGSKGGLLRNSDGPGCAFCSI